MKKTTGLNFLLFLNALIFSIIVLACGKTNLSEITKNSAYKEGSFGYDLNILSALDDLSVLKNGDAMIAVSGKLQGRIFTSTSQGMEGKSYGFFKREFIKNNKWENNLSKIGGEGRMWFGPEIGTYSIFFDPGTEQTANTIHLSPDLNTVLFEPLKKTETTVSYGGKMKIRNANSYIFELYAKRTLSILNTEMIQETLEITPDNKLSYVAFSAETSIKNIGKEKWKKENGLLSIWDIACILPTPNTTIIIPVKENTDTATIYFTPIDENRIRVKGKVIYYKADAAYMNKIGIQPEFCSNVFGSYSPELNLLTVVKFRLDRDGIYVNSLWGHKDPYKGDVINVFNGEINKNLDRDWPFYELETSSPAKELAVGEEMSHYQIVYHFEGDEAELNSISMKLFGVSLKHIKHVFTADD